MLGVRLATMHNLRFYLNLMQTIRTAIENDYFDDLQSNFVEVK
jgi:tRNA-guanine family transglycosylase